MSQKLSYNLRRTAELPCSQSGNKKDYLFDLGKELYVGVKFTTMIAAEQKCSSTGN